MKHLPRWIGGLMTAVLSSHALAYNVFPYGADQALNGAAILLEPQVGWLPGV